MGEYGRIDGHGSRPILFAAARAIYKLVICSPVEPQIVPARIGRGRIAK